MMRGQMACLFLLSCSSVLGRSRAKAPCCKAAWQEMPLKRLASNGLPSLILVHDEVRPYDWPRLHRLLLRPGPFLSCERPH